MMTSDLKQFESSRSSSPELLERARSVLVGGVNSPVRSFKSVNAEPLLVRRASGATIEDESGRIYIDLIGAWGAAILGHAHPAITRAAQKAMADGACFGLTSMDEVRLAEVIRDRVPGVVERVRFTNSGTEAVMTAIKLARGVTGRRRVVKFVGNYHGHSPTTMHASNGKDDGQVLVELPFNDLATVESFFVERGHEVACVIVEPVCGNMGVVAALPGFLEALRALTKEVQALLIFDEVMTGFRVDLGGAVERFGIQPDLVTYGKIIGGGFPVGAVAGPGSLMDQLAPVGPIYHAGTFAGNPVTMAAGLAAFEQLTADVYTRLESLGAKLEMGLMKAAHDHTRSVQVQRVGSMISLFFSNKPVVDFESAEQSDTRAFAAFFHAMLEAGILLPPSPQESWFLSAAHDEWQIGAIIDAAHDAFGRL